jgi:hypothetical protein
MGSIGATSLDLYSFPSTGRQMWTVASSQLFSIWNGSVPCMRYLSRHTFSVCVLKFSNSSHWNLGCCIIFTREVACASDFVLNLEKYFAMLRAVLKLVNGAKVSDVERESLCIASLLTGGGGVRGEGVDLVQESP